MMIKTSIRRFKLNGVWLSRIKAGREYGFQTVADGICFVCLLGFAVCFWVLHCVLLCSAKKLSNRGRRVVLSLYDGSYCLDLVKFSQQRKYQTFSDSSGLWPTATLFWRAGWKKQGVKDTTIRDLRVQIEIKKVSRKEKSMQTCLRGRRKKYEHRT